MSKNPFDDKDKESAFGGKTNFIVKMSLPIKKSSSSAAAASKSADPAN